MPVSPSMRRLIAERDLHRCAYCLTTEDNCGLRMHVDHIIPESEGGSTTLDNLCLACFSCNIAKGARQTGVDPDSGETISLFNPVSQTWSEHFAWDKVKTHIIGLTPPGRATIKTLDMNNLTVVRARHRWVSAGWHQSGV